VSYTHENSEVIGTSKVEAYLSKRAEKAASNKTNWDTQEQLSKVFQDESQTGIKSDRVYSDGEGDSIITPDGDIRYKYKPPEAVQRRQFCSMARWAGYGDDVVSFALVVENWTQAQRRECLDRFYHARRDVLAGLVKEEEFYHNDVKTEKDIKMENDEIKAEEDKKHEVKVKAEHIELQLGSEDEDDEL
jgi:hypothetical protein